MNLLIKSAKIINPGNGLDGQVKDILVKDGQISAIADALEAKNAKIIQADDLHVSIGWLDIGVQTGDPGYEHRESFDSIGAAAAAGGYTAVSCQPNTLPVVQTKSDILYVRNNALGQVVDFLPMGAITHDIEGKEITEMIDMSVAGAVAFTDGKHSIQHPGIMLRALQYVKTFDGLIINQPQDKTIAKGGQMHEGVVSTSLGLRGIPAIAESLMVQRDLQLLEYTDSRLHLFNITTATAVKLIREAKSNGLRVSAGVSINNLVYTDQDLQTFDSNLKVNPPLRNQEDKEALIEGILDGTIDTITTNHVPVEEEGKKLEFAYADFGAIGLETVYPLYVRHLANVIPLDVFISKIAHQPRQVLGQKIPVLEEGQAANLTVFTPATRWKYEANTVKSRSCNSPLIGADLQGRVVAVVNKNLSYILPGL